MPPDTSRLDATIKTLIAQIYDTAVEFVESAEYVAMQAAWRSYEHALRVDASSAETPEFQIAQSAYDRRAAQCRADIAALRAALAAARSGVQR